MDTFLLTVKLGFHGGPNLTVDFLRFLKCVSSEV